MNRLIAIAVGVAMAGLAATASLALHQPPPVDTTDSVVPVVVRARASPQSPAQPAPPQTPPPAAAASARGGGAAGAGNATESREAVVVERRHFRGSGSVGIVQGTVREGESGTVYHGAPPGSEEASD